MLSLSWKSGRLQDGGMPLLGRRSDRSITTAAICSPYSQTTNATQQQTNLRFHFIHLAGEIAQFFDQRAAHLVGDHELHARCLPWRLCATLCCVLKSKRDRHLFEAVFLFVIDVSRGQRVAVSCTSKVRKKRAHVKRLPVVGAVGTMERTRCWHASTTRRRNSRRFISIHLSDGWFGILGLWDSRVLGCMAALPLQGMYLSYDTWLKVGWVRDQPREPASVMLPLVMMPMSGKPSLSTTTKQSVCVGKKWAVSFNYKAGIQQQSTPDTNNHADGMGWEGEGPTPSAAL